jgi:hypothetical protein
MASIAVTHAGQGQSRSLQAHGPGHEVDVVVAVERVDATPDAVLKAEPVLVLALAVCSPVSRPPHPIARMSITRAARRMGVGQGTSGVAMWAYRQSAQASVRGIGAGA